MTPLPLIWRPAAQADAVNIAMYYARAGGSKLEVGFLGELEAAFELIASHPDCGSSRHAVLFPELPVPLRFHPLRRFERILVYYMALPKHVDIIRIWDAARGLEALLADSAVK